MGIVDLRLRTIDARRHEPSPAGEIVNAFPIKFAADASLGYRVWSIYPTPATPKLREQIRSYLWQHSLKTPVAATRLDGEFAYAVSATAEEQAVEYVGAGGKRYTVRPTSVMRSIRLAAPTNDDEVEFASAMLQSSFAIHLRDDRDLFRGHWPDRFYMCAADSPWRAATGRPGRPTPFPQAGGRSLVDIFRGFLFKVLYFQGIGFCVVVDVVTSYIGSRSLKDYLASGQGIPDSLRRDDGLSRWVNDYGYVKQSLYLIRPEKNRTIGNTPLEHGNVYTFLQNKGPYVRRTITAQDQAATVIYKVRDRDDEDKHYTASVALLKPIFTTEAHEVRELQDTSAFPPAERLARIRGAIGYLRGASVEGVQLALAEPIRQPARCLPLPRLAFGPSGMPTVIAPPDEALANDQAARLRWNQEKMGTIRKHGPFRSSPLGTPYLVYPAGLDRDGVLECFVEETKRQLQILGRDGSDFELAPYDDRAHAKDIITKVAAIESAGTASFILLGLPQHDDRAAAVYAGVKTGSRLPVKCFAAGKLKYLARDPKRFASYVQRNTLGVIMENGGAPWAPSR
jgi:hypothetical protein